MAHNTCLVCLISTVNGRSKKKLGLGGASSGHITNLKQSIFFLLISMGKALAFVQQTGLRALCSADCFNLILQTNFYSASG